MRPLRVTVFQLAAELAGAGATPGPSFAAGLAVGNRIVMETAKSRQRHQTACFGRPLGHAADSLQKAIRSLQLHFRVAIGCGPISKPGSFKSGCRVGGAPNTGRASTYYSGRRFPVPEIGVRWVTRPLLWGGRSVPRRNKTQ